MNKTKVPCATCKDLCENAVRLALVALAIKDHPDIETKTMGLHCQKTGETFELEVKG